MQWDVQHSEGGYTIQIHNQPLYIATQDVRARKHCYWMDRCNINFDRPMYSSQMSHNTSKSDFKQHRKLEVKRLISSKLLQPFLKQNYSCLICRIHTADNRLFQYNGGALSPNSNATVPKEVTAEKTTTPSLWVFQELNGDLPTPTPYSVSNLYSLITRRF
jgi:hypothetical protein